VPEAIHDPHPQRAGEESIACSHNPDNLASVVTTGQKPLLDCPVPQQMMKKLLWRIPELHEPAAAPTALCRFCSLLARSYCC